MRQDLGPPLAGSSFFLFVKDVDEVLQDECTDHLEVIVQHFEERIMLSANAVKKRRPLPFPLPRDAAHQGGWRYNCRRGVSP
jgi:hypothetical protein